MIHFLEDNSYALCDLKDESEENNIINEMPELASKLKKEITTWQKKVKAPCQQVPIQSVF